MKNKSIKKQSLLSYYGFSKAEQKKYPVITGILKKLTSERIKKEIEEIQKTELPPEIQKWVKEYEKVGGRDRFIWKWIYYVVPYITFPIIQDRYRRSLYDVKSGILALLTFIINDLADNFKSKLLLDELIKNPFNKSNKGFRRLTTKERNYLKFIKEFWGYLFRRIKQYPQYKDLKDIFEYDVLQVLISIKYDYLITINLNFLNKIESEVYQSHTMGAIPCVTLDLMCSNKFNLEKIAVLREITWESEKMARIGNWVSTWEREIPNNDFTSGVFIYALTSKVLTVDDLKKGDQLEIVRRIKKANIEKELLKEWEGTYKKIKNINKRLGIISLNKFFLGLEKLLVLELISRKYK